VESNRRWTGSP